MWALTRPQKGEVAAQKDFSHRGCLMARPKTQESSLNVLSTLSFGAAAVPLLHELQQGTGAMWLLRSGQVPAWMLHSKRLPICALPVGKPLLLWAAVSHGCSSHWTIYTQGTSHAHTLLQQ